MNYPTALARSILPWLGGVLVGAYLGSLCFAAYLRMGDGSALQRWLQVPLDALGLSLFALLAAAPAALLVGWPTYAFLLHKGRADWLTSAAIPLLPAALVWVLGDGVIAALLAWYGLCIAWVTHALRLRFVPVAATPGGA